MKLSRSLMFAALLGLFLGAACSTKKAAKAPSPAQAMPPPVVVAPPVPPAVPAPAPALTPLVTGLAVAVPPAPATGPLPAGVLAWDSENKSIDVHDGEDQGHLFFDFTNVSPTDVVISNVHPGCGCTTAQFPVPQTFAPGSNSRINLSIALRGKFGTLFKNVTVTTDKGIKVLNFRVNILPFEQPKLTEAARGNMIKAAMADRQAVFKPDCATCHVRQGENKYGQFLYNADCGICHEREHRASMVPDLHTIKVPTNVEFWRAWIAHGKPGSLMPAFATSDGGPLTDMQIATLAQYLNYTIPSKAVTNASAAVPR